MSKCCKKSGKKTLKPSAGALWEKLNGGKDYYEIRLESIGGLGANLCGKMLGELGLRYLDLNSSSFASYGSEKTGTPVKGFVRYCKKEKEIRVHFPVEKPDLLVIFHQALLKDESVWKGCDKDTVVIVAAESVDKRLGEETNTESKAENNLINLAPNLLHSLQQRKESFAQCYVLEAQKFAMDTKSRINVVMLGAVLRVMGVDDMEIGRQICADTLGKKYPDALENNLLGMEKGFREVQLILGDSENCHGSMDCGCDVDKDSEVEDGYKVKKCHENDKCNDECKSSSRLQKEEWGYAYAPLGGVNPNFGSTVTADLSPSRQGFIPLFIKERCINCGLCHSTCPDMVFQFAKGEYKGREMMVNQGLDYFHCKGCLRCVDVCPVNALVRGAEAEHPRKEYFIPNQELIRCPQYYEEAGPDGYITSESYLTEKRMEGGEV
ncbi:MAG: 2-oxoacid:acceptor oxidoreductase family protein [Lachnospiraceae bacterium]|nr:2-oxoacid:acceptor oxidoreductase family protein [Lachnospiraceae bacterium]